MRKSIAQKIAKSGKITWGELQATLKRAHAAGATDERRAVVNKSFTKAMSYNVMGGYAQGYDAACVVGSRYGQWLGAQHILREFGEFWEGWRPPVAKRKQLPVLHHEQPKEFSF